HTARVLRDGQVVVIDADAIVPGDVVMFEAGDLVPADLRIDQASRLEADESLLTGESAPVAKSPDPVAPSAPLHERSSMLFKGSAVTRGAGAGIAVATGMATELGRIAALVEAAEEGEAPIEERIRELGGRLVLLTLVIATATAVTGILAGRDTFLMIETGIALAVAAIPEGLPIVATISLARGMWRMAARNVLINRLSAVETLGATSVLFTDKTGTLTENRMTVREVVVPAGAAEIVAAPGSLAGEARVEGDGRAAEAEILSQVERALAAGVLCNDATVRAEGEGVFTAGDPLEVALLVAGARVGLERDALLAKRPEERQEAFDPELRMMATVHAHGSGYVAAVKGAAEAVIPACVSQAASGGGERALSRDARADWLEAAAAMARRGLRVLALAARELPAPDGPIFEGLTLLGLVGMLDPPRDDVAPALADCRRAGVRVNLVTGDHPDTARAVALAVGLVDDPREEVVTGAELQERVAGTAGDRAGIRAARLFARVDPEQKLDLVRLHQETGAVVGMTGDGVNDAPALKAADVGVAMGERGTQVARDAADVVLRDDRLSSIVAAIRQGRTVFENIRKFVFYLMSCNVSEIMVVSVASFAGLPPALLPLHILFLNLVTDVFPALALGMGDVHASILERRPRRPETPILERRHWLGIWAFGALITASVLAALVLAHGWLALSPGQTLSVSFLTVALAQLWHVFNARQAESSILDNAVVRNPWVWGALGLCLVLVLAAVYAPGLSEVLELEAPGRDGWTLVLVASSLPLVVGQLWLASVGLATRLRAGRQSGGVSSARSR
ncbi:MAG: cation-transporting P-type ATPase, partial [Thermoanaerobaculia bacterium]|nr:cation-transporting P-type ATPase [Thermoanaerobaculia bacterium]